MTEACHTSLCNVMPRPAGHSVALTTIRLSRHLGSAVLRSSSGVKPVFQVSAVPSPGCWNHQTTPDDDQTTHLRYACTAMKSVILTADNDGNVTSLHARLKLYNHIFQNLLTCSQSYHKQISQAEICKSTQWITLCTSTHMCTHQCTGNVLLSYCKHMEKPVS